MESPFPAVHTKWSLVFLSFETSSQRLKTDLSLVYNNNANISSNISNTAAPRQILELHCSVARDGAWLPFGTRRKALLHLWLYYGCSLG